MVSRLLGNKSTPFAIFIGALVAYLLFISYTATPYSVSATFDPEVVEQAKDRFPDTSKPSERSTSPSSNLICDDPVHGNGGSCDASQEENIFNTSPSRAALDDTKSQSELATNQPPLLTAGGLILLTTILGITIWTVKKRRK